eukprot:TRINITY_DN49064_c0_g1_i1.p1 TRINITY_DN49064_c0_g1~~TRINITY_DN49064_c0_g1_i1.p1  ORF type:complete len:347 (-),score=74.63 TRINITY_DN49064_c0_g1_i1:95-1135(-)
MASAAAAAGAKEERTQPPRLHLVQLDGLSLEAGDRARKGAKEKEASDDRPVARAVPVRENIDYRVRMHLQNLQKKNRVQKQQREEEKRQLEEQERCRGQPRVRRGEAPHSARRSASPSAPRCARGPSPRPREELPRDDNWCVGAGWTVGGKASRGGGGWQVAGGTGSGNVGVAPAVSAEVAPRPPSPPSSWEASTVQIVGEDGAVHAIRPSGERYSVEPPEGEGVDDQTRKFALDQVVNLGGVADDDLGVPGAVDEVLRATLTATHQELHELCRGVREADAADDPQIGERGGGDDDRPATRDSERAASAEELVARIGQLPRDWRGALLQLLGEAEAEAAADASSSR